MIRFIVDEIVFSVLFLFFFSITVTITLPFIIIWTVEVLSVKLLIESFISILRIEA